MLFIHTLFTHHIIFKYSTTRTEMTFTYRLQDVWVLSQSFKDYYDCFPFTTVSSKSAVLIPIFIVQGRFVDGVEGNSYTITLALSLCELKCRKKFLIKDLQNFLLMTSVFSYYTRYLQICY